MTRAAAHDRLRKIRDEMEAARFALAAAIRTWPGEAPEGSSGTALTISDLRRALRHLQATYLIRLFGCWEGILRDYWIHGVGRSTEPRLSDLIDSLCARRNIDPQTRLRAHELRELRNAIVHEDTLELRIDFPECLRSLATFLAYLLVTW